jgi:hypothetical protein
MARSRLAVVSSDELALSAASVDACCTNWAACSPILAKSIERRDSAWEVESCEVAARPARRTSNGAVMTNLCCGRHA